MTREEIENNIESILRSHGFLMSDAEGIFNAMPDILYFMAEQTQNSEPYATVAIEAYREAANNISDFESMIESFITGETEDDEE